MSGRSDDVTEIERLLAALMTPRKSTLPQPTLVLAATTMLTALTGQGDFALPDQVVADTLTVVRAMQVGKQWGKWQVALFPFLPLAMADSSDNYRLPAPARNLIYGLRKLTNLGASTFDTALQKYITDGSVTRPSLVQAFIDRFPTVAANWPTILRDARGSFRPPHGHPMIPLSTTDVERYLDEISESLSDKLTDDMPRFAVTVPVAGPFDIYGSVLLIEKETFHMVLEADGISDRRDLAIMSGKGFIGDAGKTLIDALLDDFDITPLGLFDLDLNGIRMGRHLEARGGVWIGLTWEDIEHYRLEDVSEPVTYAATGTEDVGVIEFDPRDEFREAGLDEHVIAFLVDTVTFKADGKVDKASGRRIELNALSAAQLIDLIERKLDAHNVGKAIPGDDDLIAAFKRMKRLTVVNRLIAKLEDLRIDDPDLHVLVPRIEEAFEHDPTRSWVEVVRTLVEAEVDEEEQAIEATQ